MSLIIPGAGRGLDLATIEIIQQLPFSGDVPWRPENKSTAREGWQVSPVSKQTLRPRQKV
jgi:hypothetical protein